MSQVIKKLKDKFQGSILDAKSDGNEDFILITPDILRRLLRYVKDTKGLDFNILMDLTAVDYKEDEDFKERFEVIYQLYALNFQRRLFIRIRLKESALEIPTISDLWPIADWLEREVWDMFGINFSGHPNLKRLLMYEEFEGHPLRKDYPYSKRQPLIGPQN
jgi:NADH-quinone oxidoreductase subunit C